MTTVQLGDVLKPSLDEVRVDRERTYQSAGVRSFAKGLFIRPSIVGGETSYRKLVRIHRDQVVLSRLFAWEGAVALVPSEFDGYFVSSEFPTFEINSDLALPQYVGAFLRWPKFHDDLAGVTRGLGQRRQRVHVDEFLKLQIPLPPPEDQHSIAGRLDRIRGASTALKARAAHASTLTDAAHHSLVDSFLASGLASGWPLRSLSKVASINPRPARLAPDDPVSFVPMAAVDAITGSVAYPEIKLASDIGSGYKQFAVGDVIFARITPSMQNGKCAVFEGPQAFGYGSTEFHVVRPGLEVQARWLHRVMRSFGFRRKAAERFKGTAGQQRVPADFLRTVRVPVPPISDQDAAVAELDRIERYGLELAAKRTRADELISALEAAAINHEFSALT